ncbi:hypothetical protein [Ferruginibacter sp. HRS2-29]|uniref:hypothetical protein n=1 Tax=Ferruginibacter sp. HRS2-29 TaxID=2487334 RepID=UPI0020CDC4A8|nr:hypothetical protein [Ferruginibacter sp. HRS2-29]
MKTQSTFLAALSSKTLNQLTTQVAETLAVVTTKKAFTSADLWSIQKQRKAVSIRRFA